MTEKSKHKLVEAISYICPECNGDRHIVFTIQGGISPGGMKEYDIRSSRTCGTCEGEGIIWKPKNK